MATRRDPRYGIWRLVGTAPAALVSAVQVAVVAQLLGRWWLLGVLGWAAAGFASLAPALERRAVRSWCRFGVPAGADREWLQGLQSAVERRCALPSDCLDWYVRDTEAPNAYAAGRRSVAVSTGLLRLLSTGQLTGEHAVAIGVHEVGHHTTGSARHGLLAQWWSWPWQATYRGIMRLGGGLPFADAAVVLLPVLFGIAIVQTAAQDAPAAQKVPVPVPVLVLVLVLLGVLAVGIFVHPVADAALARAGEYAADRYAVRVGAGEQLAAALCHVTACESELHHRPHNSHPPLAKRLRRLHAAGPVTVTASLASGSAT